MSDRPIKGNASGQYNLNFIDPNNDIPAYYDGLTDLQELIEQYFETIEYSEYQQLTEQQLKQRCINQSYCQSKQHFKKADICSICLSKFTPKQNVKILPCSHCFHEQCVAPWFQKNDKCPNCRYSIKNQQYCQQ